MELTWEVNHLIPYDGSHFQTGTAIFNASDQKEFLKDKSFEIQVSTDGTNFAKIATVQGTMNKYLHKDVEKGRLYHYIVNVVAKDQEIVAKSPAIMGAAGKNLFKKDSFKNPSVDPPNDQNGVSIAQGEVPYSKSQKLVRLQFSGTTRQLSFWGNLVPISANKRYLQGGGLRAPGDVWLGRYFYDAEKNPMGYGYSMMSVRNTPQWTSAVQLLLPDNDGTGFKRKDGLAYSVAQKQWTFPPEASYMAVFVTAFGSGEAGDFWIVEIDQ